MRRRWIVCAALVALTCKPEGGRHGGPVVSRISGQGEGNLVQFDLHPLGDQQVRISSNDVQAQRAGTSLLVNFDKVEFAHRPEEKDEIDLGSLTVWVSGRSGSNEPDFFRESEEKALPRLRLAGEGSRAHIDHVQLEVKDVAEQCRRSCTLTVAVSTAQGKATADAVEIQLDAGKVAPITWGQAPALTAEPAPPPAVAQSPCSFTAERAAKALGQPMLPLSRTAADCTIVPAKQGPIPYSIEVTERPAKFFYQKTEIEGAEMMAIGDRAVWLPATTTLIVQKGQWTLTVVTESRDVAEEVARKVLVAL